MRLRSACAWRRRSSVPPRVCLTPDALRSVILRISPSELRSDAAAVECSTFAWLIRLICLAVFCAAALMLLFVPLLKRLAHGADASGDAPANAA